MGATVQIIFEGVDNASRVAQSIARQTQAIGGKMQAVGGQIMDMGGALTAATAPVAIGLGLSAAAAIDFETAMAGVQKAANLDADGYAEMSDQILQLSRTIPLAATEIAGITEAGAKLGVSGARNLGQFTELISEMSVAFDMASSDAADSAATIANVFNLKDGAGNLDFGAIRQYGDVVNTLGDNMATTERAIVSATREMSGTASSYQITANETAALAAGFTSLGVQPGVAANAFKVAMSRMSNATPAVAAGMEALGISVEDFQQAVSSGDGAEAFAQAMQTIKDSSLDPIAKGKAMRDVFGGNFDDTMGQAAAGAEQFSQALEHMGNAMDGGQGASTMASSFEIMANTTKSQMQIAKNAVTELGITIGSAMLPAINSVLGGLTPLVQKFAEFGRANPRILSIATAFAAVVAAVGPVLVAIGAVVSSVGKIGTALGALKGIGAFSALKGAIAGIAAIGAGPILAIAAAGLAIFKFWKPITTLLGGIAKGFSSALSAMNIDVAGMLAPIRSAVEAAKGLISNIFSQSDIDLSGLGEKIGSAIGGAVAGIGNAIASIPGAGAALKVIGTVAMAAVAGLVALKAAFMGVSAVMGVVVGVIGSFSAIGSAILGVVGAISAAFSTIAAVVGAVVAAITSPIALVIAAIVAWGAVIYTLVTRWNEVKMAAMMAVTGIATMLTTALTTIGTTIGMFMASIVARVVAIGMSISMAVMGIVMQVQMAIANVITAIGATIGAIAGVLASIAGTIAGIIGSITATVSSAIAGTIAAVQSGLAALPGVIQGVGAQMIGTITGLAGQFFSAGQALIQQLAAGIQAAAGQAMAAISSVAAQVRGAMPFSPAKWGPLSDIDKTGGALVHEFARGIEPAPVTRSLDSTMAAVRRTLEPSLVASVGALNEDRGLTAEPRFVPASGGGDTTNSTTTGGSSIVVNYSPTINAAGVDDLERQEEEHFEKLLQMLEDRQARSQYTRYGAQL